MKYITRPSGLRATLLNWVPVQIWADRAQIAHLHLIGTVRGHDRVSGIIITSPVMRLLRLPAGRILGAITGSQGRLYRLVGDCTDFKIEHLKMLAQALHAWGVDAKDWGIADDEVLAKIAGADRGG